MLAVHCNPDGDALKLRSRVGSATFNTVVSSVDMKSAAQQTARITPFRLPVPLTRTSSWPSMAICPETASALLIPFASRDVKGRAPATKTLGRPVEQLPADAGGRQSQIPAARRAGITSLPMSSRTSSK